MEPRQYSKSEIRAIRIFLVVLLAIGAFSLVGGFANLHRWPSVNNEPSQSSHNHGMRERNDKTMGEKVTEKGKGKSRGNVPLMYFISSTVFLALAGAGILAVRRVLANGMRDVELDPVDAVAEQGGQLNAASRRPLP